MPCRADRLEFDYVDLADADVLPASFKPNTKLVFLKTPTNPTMKVADIASVAEAAHAHGAVLERVRLVLFAESLGGTESLVTYPLVQTHGSIPGPMLDKLGIDERLLRLSVGLENAEDLIADLEQAIG